MQHEVLISTKLVLNQNKQMVCSLPWRHEGTNFKTSHSVYSQILPQTHSRFQFEDKPLFKSVKVRRNFPRLFIRKGLKLSTTRGDDDNDNNNNMAALTKWNLSESGLMFETSWEYGAAVMWRALQRSAASSSHTSAAAFCGHVFVGKWLRRLVSCLGTWEVNKLQHQGTFDTSFLSVFSD